MKRCILKFDSRATRSLGEYPVKMYIPDARMYVSTGVSVTPAQWKDGKVVSHPRAKMLNTFLQNMLLRSDSLILGWKSDGTWKSLLRDKKALRAQLLGEEMPGEGTFMDVARKFNERHQGRTHDLYEVTFRRLERYTDMRDVMLEDITPDWLMRLDKWLGGSVNGRAIHMRNIRAVFNYALDEELTTFYPFRKFKIRREPTRHRSLSLDDVKAIRDLDMDWGHMNEYRDTFMLIIYLIGINLADLWSPKTKVVDGRLEYTRAKTGRLYSIKLEPEAVEILRRIGMGKNHLLASMDRYKDLHDYTRRLNEGLKRMGPVIGKGGNGSPKTKPMFPQLTSYWARHTWATLASELDIPKETISAALGHEIGSRITSIYIDYDQRKVDAANRRVIDCIVEKRRWKLSVV